MKMKIAFATATALGLLMSTAMADNNKGVVVQGTAASDSTGSTASIDQSGGNNNLSKLTQLGDQNNATVRQFGNNNGAGDHVQFSGTDASSNVTGYNYITQNGNNNNLEIDQSKNGNYIARDGFLKQTGNFNDAEITQVGGASSGNRVNKVEQKDATGTASALTNSLDVHQSGASVIGVGSDYNYSPNLIENVQQTWTGGGSANVLSVTQTGAIFNRGNIVKSAVQNGFGHQGTIEQSGLRNRVELLSQSGNSNTATIILDGDGNGSAASGNVNGTFKSGRGAEAAGAAASTVSQSGSANAVNYQVLGADRNQFGFYQDGTGNQATGITITGDANELGVNQTGDRNSLTLSAISGDENIIGLKQNGSDNVATINVSGNRNVGFNDFTSGPAGNLATSAGLTAGLLVQDGLGNSVSLTVTNGDNNVFASLQDGDTNVITATQSGSSNEAAVAQNGNGNAASVSQIGGSNSVSIQQ